MMQQRIIRETGSYEFKQALDNAIFMGWGVLSIAVDSSCSVWMAVIHKDK